MSLEFDILFEDDSIVAINKPPRVLVIQDRFNKLEPNLHDILTKKYEKIFTLHRLDKETSGVLLFAKNQQAHRELSIQFETHKVQKKYNALLKGIPKTDEGIIDVPIGKKNEHENVMIPDRKKGKPSTTLYNVIKKYKGFSLVEAFPKTGRTHQLRVHFKSIGCPLAIDKLYNGNEKIFLSDIKSKFTPSAGGEKPLMDRLTLHAAAIDFIHPDTKNKIKIEAPHFKDFRSLLKNLDKYGL